MNWITIEELLYIHEGVSKEISCATGILNVGGLETVLVRPFTSFDGQEMFPDLNSKVAVLIHSLVAFHPFVDGNCSLALIVADVCLRLNGRRVVSSEENAKFFNGIASGEKSVADITEWLEVHTESWHLDSSLNQHRS
ncbi:MAG: type II toxin-antitoxin system death-on-curing family toxin [Chlorobiales bacterium]|nr:type II toxin-antitoxin system death-on-curing family toxin [Chlorobiales bacterium]